MTNFSQQLIIFLQVFTFFESSNSLPINQDGEIRLSKRIMLGSVAEDASVAAAGRTGAGTGAGIGGSKFVEDFSDTGAIPKVQERTNPVTKASVVDGAEKTGLSTGEKLGAGALAVGVAGAIAGGSVAGVEIGKKKSNSSSDSTTSTSTSFSSSSSAYPSSSLI